MLRLLTLLCALGWLLPATAFEARAHIAICELSWQLVQDDTRQWLQQTIAGSPQTRFNSGCTWPDEARREHAWEHTGGWHYVNVPRRATQVSAADCPADGCLMTAIPAMEKRLQNNPADWQALLFLAHFIADLHQPLHVSFADDRGGNRARLTFNGERTNLHRLWDGDLLGRYVIRQLLTDWQTQLTAEQKARWCEGDISAWAAESLQLTHRIYHRYQQSQQEGSAYRDEFAPQLQQRMARAGVRLSCILDNLYAQRLKNSAVQ